MKSEKIMMWKSSRWEFHWALLFFVLIMVVVNFPIIIASWLGFRFSSNPQLELIVTIFPLIICSVMVVLFVKRAKRLSWFQSIQFLGFKIPNYKQIIVGLVCVSPVIVCYVFSYIWFRNWGYSPIWQRHWIISLFFMVFSTGLFNEVIFRGFFFRCLRFGRTFFTSALLSSLLWAFYHFTFFLMSRGNGVGDIENFKRTLWTSSFAFLSGFAGAYVYECGGNVIWGWLLVNVVIDSVSVLGFDTPKGFIPGLPTIYSSIGVFVSYVIAFPVTHWMLFKKSSRNQGMEK